MVASVCTDGKTPEADPRRIQLEAGALTQIAGEQAEHHVGATLLDSSEQFENAWQHPKAGASQLRLQSCEIAPPQLRQPRRDVLVLKARRLEQLRGDLRVGLSSEGVPVDRARRSEDLHQGIAESSGPAPPAFNRVPSISNKTRRRMCVRLK